MKGCVSLLSSLYDEIGIEYDTTRKADMEIARRLYNHLQIFDNRPVVDIACGTGNYTIALSDLGVNISGIDISQEMIMSASKKTAEIDWTIGDVTNLPFENSQFSGAICVLSIHHFNNLNKSFSEINRILDSGSRFVIFTSTPEQMERYWLNEYFPQMMKKSLAQMPSIQTVNKTLQESGFSIVGNETFMIQPNLEDFFLYSGKYKPEIYLNEKVRSGISSFVTLAEIKEVEEGIKNLASDIKNSSFYQRTKGYYSNLGDYSFVVAEKNRL